MKEQKSSQKRAKAKFDMGRKEHGMDHGSFCVYKWSPLECSHYCSVQSGLADDVGVRVGDSMLHFQILGLRRH